MNDDMPAWARAMEDQLHARMTELAAEQGKALAGMRADLLARIDRLQEAPTPQQQESLMRSWNDWRRRSAR